MTQFDFGTIDPDEKSGSQLAEDLGNWRDALLTRHKGSSRPSYIVAGMEWISDAVSPWTVYAFDGANDIPIGYIDSTTHEYSAIVGGTVKTLASAATTDLGSVKASHVSISGSVTITSFGTTMPPGTMKTVAFTGSPSITHSSAISLPEGISTTMSAGDRLLVVCTASNAYTVMMHTRAGSSTVEEPGVVKEYGGLRVPTGYLWADGSAVSRSTYGALFSALTLQTTGNTTNTSKTITSVVSTADVVKGMPISGPGIPAGSLVDSFVANTSITMTLAATATATGIAIVIAPHGVGNGTTTFNVPNRCGYSALGRDNMTGAAQNIGQITTTLTTSNGSATATVGSATGVAIGMAVACANVPPNVTITDISGTTVTLSSGTGVVAGTTATCRLSYVQDAQRLGATGGGLTKTQVLKEIASHTHTGTTDSNGAHTHTVFGSQIGYTGPAALADVLSTASGARNKTTSSDGVHTHPFTTDSSGSGLPMITATKQVVMNFIIKT